MISALLAIKAFFAAVMAVWAALAIGAIGGVVGAAFRFWWGLAGSAAVGAVTVAIVLFGGFVTDESDRIARLKAENKALTLKTEELRVTGAALRNTLSELSRASLHNEKVMADLQAKLDATPDKPECIISKEIVDELNKIQ